MTEDVPRLGWSTRNIPRDLFHRHLTVSSTASLRASASRPVKAARHGVRYQLMLLSKSKTPLFGPFPEQRPLIAGAGRKESRSRQTSEQSTIKGILPVCYLSSWPSLLFHLESTGRWPISGSYCRLSLLSTLLPETSRRLRTDRDHQGSIICPGQDSHPALFFDSPWICCHREALLSEIYICLAGPPFGQFAFHPFDSLTCVDVLSFLFCLLFAFIMKLIFILSAALMASVSAKPCIRLNSTLIPSPSDPGAKGVSFLEAASESNSTSQQNSVVPVAFGSSSRSSSMPAASSSAPPAAPFSPPGIQQDTPSGGLPTANTSLRTNTSLSTGPSTKGSITCPGGFLNIVFNTDANTEPSLDNRFTTLQKYGANGWSMLSLLNYRTVR
jgi:hypothetical protein